MKIKFERYIKNRLRGNDVLTICDNISDIMGKPIISMKNPIYINVRLPLENNVTSIEWFLFDWLKGEYR